MSETNELDENDSEGIKNLRKQFDAQAKELKELREFREQREKEQRDSTVANALKSKAGNDEKLATRLAKAAKFYDGEDTSDEAVTKWLDDNADVFGIAKSATDPNEQNAERVINSSFGEPAHVDDGLTNVPLGDIEKRRELLRTLSLEECQKLGLVPTL